MKLLLDTHAFLWWLSSPDQLTASATTAISDPTNTVYVSVVSLWEISIKRAIGKLQAPIDLQNDVSRSGFTLLPLHVEHIVRSEKLLLIHRDPFDRILIAQAGYEDATLVTRDPQFPQYNLPLILA